MTEARIYKHEGKFYWESETTGYGPFLSLRDAAYDIVIHEDSEDLEGEGHE